MMNKISLLAVIRGRAGVFDAGGDQAAALEIFNKQEIDMINQLKAPGIGNSLRELTYSFFHPEGQLPFFAQ